MDWALLLQILALAPTVGVTAVAIERLVELAQQLGWVPAGKALLYSAGLNALMYVGLFLAGHYGYSTQVYAGIEWVNVHLDLIVAAVSLVALAGTSTAMSKVVHEAIKLLQKWTVKG